MSSCQGELIQTPFKVRAVDPSGEVLLAGSFATLRNGFMELWLPRNRTVNLSIEGLNRSVDAVISTVDGSDTCITTLQLR